MKFFLLLIALATPAFAEEPFHMISFGRDGFGWSAAGEKIDTESESPFSSVKYFLNDLALNYAFRVNNRIQLGAFYQNSHTQYKFKNRGGNTSKTEIEQDQSGIFFLYNFSEDMNDAWYAGYAFSITQYEEENSHDLQDAENKSPFELDDANTTHELIVGKRFSLRGFNVDNLAYSPQVKFIYQTHGKDFDDNQIGNGTGVNVQPIRFDLLF